MAAFYCPALALQRELKGKRTQPMPKRIDAVLHFTAADVLFAENDTVGAMAAIARGVETVPGVGELIAFEKALLAGDRPELGA